MNLLKFIEIFVIFIKCNSCYVLSKNDSQLDFDYDLTMEDGRVYAPLKNHQGHVMGNNKRSSSITSTASTISVMDHNSTDDFQTYNVGVLMASHLDSPFDLERCGPAVDLALERVNEEFLKSHRIRLKKVQGR